MSFLSTLRMSLAHRRCLDNVHNDISAGYALVGGMADEPSLWSYINTQNELLKL